MGCGVGRRRSSDPVFLWLWCRLVVTAPIGPLAWEPPYAAGAAQEMAKQPKKKKRLPPRHRIALAKFTETDSMRTKLAAPADSALVSVTN